MPPATLASGLGQNFAVAYASKFRAPTSGGQYHWISEFAPRKYQKFLSYLMGWLCILGWQATAAGGAFMGGTQIQGLLVLNNPSYVYEDWHGTLLTIAVSAFAVMFNTVLARELPLAEGILLVVHIFAWIGIIVTLWVLAPMAEAKTVFTTFEDKGGWGNIGVSTIIGITSSLLPLIGADAAVHMSEEVRDASTAVPLSMMWTTVMNGAMAWVTVITLCFSAAAMNLDDVLASSTGYPFSKNRALLACSTMRIHTNLDCSANLLQCNAVKPCCHCNDCLAYRDDDVCRNVSRGHSVEADICFRERQCGPFQSLAVQGVAQMESSP